MTIDEIKRALDELERRGLVEMTDERRDGRPVWRTTRLNDFLSENEPELLELIVSKDWGPRER